jgi:uncharacterized membrane protein
MGKSRVEAFSDGVIAVILMAGAAYDLMVRSIHRANPGCNFAGHAKGASKRNRPVGIPAIALAFVHVLLADALYVAVAIMWLIPDRSIEQALGH